MVDVQTRSSAEATDDLRNRMRLRLAMNASRVHAHPLPVEAAASIDAPTVPTVSSQPNGQQGPQPEISQMVWNSVLETLSTGIPATASDQPDQPGSSNGVGAGPTGPPPIAQHPVSAYEPQPLYPVSVTTSDGQQRTLAELLAAAAVSPAIAVAAVPAAPLSSLVVAAAQVAQAAQAAQGGAPVASNPTYVPYDGPDVVAQPAATVVAPTPAIVVEAAATTAVPNGMIVPSIPVLSQPSRAAGSVRPPQPLLDQNDSPTGHDNGGGKQSKKSKKSGKAAPLGPSQASASRPTKRKRRPFRAFFAFLLIVAMLGGAAYGGWYYFLKNKITWAQDVQPSVDIVEAALNRDFTESVAISTLSVPEYEVKLGVHALTWAYGDPDSSMTALRAVGLASRSASASSIGRIAAVTNTSFYDPTDKVIYRVDGTSSLFEFGLIRSLAVALTDQQLGWSTAFAGLTDSQRVGLMAIVHGVGNDVFEAEARLRPTELEAIATELAGRWVAAGVNEQSPIYATMVVASTFNGSGQYPLAPVDDPLSVLAVPSSDGVVFDLTRDPLAPMPPVAVPAGGGLAPRTLGMQFWYESMIPALGIDAARAAALLWAGDSTVVYSPNGFACINANIATANEVDQVQMSAALMQWAQTRPASSQAVVISQPGNITSVSMCEPAEGSADALAGLDADRLHRARSAEAEVATALIASGLPDTRAAWNCAVLAHRGGALANYDPNIVDAIVTTQMNDIINFCSG